MCRKAWKCLADDTVSFNPAGLCCWEGHSTGVAVCKLAHTAGVTQIPCGEVTWKTDEWHMPVPVLTAQIGLCSHHLPSRSSFLLS